MAGCQPCSRSEDQSPQPSSSGYPLQAVMGEESPGPSAPRVDPHPPPPSCGWKRRREESEEETAPGGEDVWVVETLCGLKMKLKRQRLSSVLPEHHEVFNRLLAVRDNDRAPLFTEDPNPSSLLTTPQGYYHIFLAKDPVVKRFLAWDKNLRVSDKYLLSMVIAYFSRAGLFSWQFQRIHFFVALYLANDMEEDNQDPKQAIFSFLYGKNRSQRPLFHKLRFQFIRSMGWKTRVSREECEEIQAFDPELWVWGRDRTLMP